MFILQFKFLTTKDTKYTKIKQGFFRVSCVFRGQLLCLGGNVIAEQQG